jgi:hypothetical protein
MLSILSALKNTYKLRTLTPLDEIDRYLIVEDGLNPYLNQFCMKYDINYEVLDYYNESKTCLRTQFTNIGICSLTYLGVYIAGTGFGLDIYDNTTRFSRAQLENFTRCLMVNTTCDPIISRVYALFQLSNYPYVINPISNLTAYISSLLSTASSALPMSYAQIMNGTIDSFRAKRQNCSFNSAAVCFNSQRVKINCTGVQAFKIVFFSPELNRTINFETLNGSFPSDFGNKTKTIWMPNGKPWLQFSEPIGGWWKGHMILTDFSTNSSLLLPTPHLNIKMPMPSPMSKRPPRHHHFGELMVKMIAPASVFQTGTGLLVDGVCPSNSRSG